MNHLQFTQKKKKKGLPPKKNKNTAIVRGEQSQVPNTTLLASVILSVYWQS